jgi:hypothetical protein
MIKTAPQTSDFLDPAKTQVAKVHVIDDTKDVYQFILIHAVHQGAYLGYTTVQLNHSIYRNTKKPKYATTAQRLSSNL